MPVPFLDAMAQAIYYYEGHQPQDLNHLNNNPGNLRVSDQAQAQDAKHYRIFDSFIEGYTELRNDIRDKITGNNAHGLNTASSLQQFFSIFAPSSDHNDPLRYAQFVAHWLGVTYRQVFTPANTFGAILSIIGQTVS
jgi:hypothetical protein